MSRVILPGGRGHLAAERLGAKTVLIDVTGDVLVNYAGIEMRTQGNAVPGAADITAALLAANRPYHRATCPDSCVRQPRTARSEYSSGARGVPPGRWKTEPGPPFVPLSSGPSTIAATCLNKVKSNSCRNSRCSLAVLPADLLGRMPQLSDLRGLTGGLPAAITAR